MKYDREEVRRANPVEHDLTIFAMRRDVQMARRRRIADGIVDEIVEQQSHSGSIGSDQRKVGGDLLEGKRTVMMIHLFRSANATLRRRMSARWPDFSSTF